MSFVNTCASKRTRGSAPTSVARALPPNASIVLNELKVAAQPLKAYVLLDRLQHRGISAPMSIYRALERLIADGLVRKIESLNAFVALNSEYLRTPMVFEICKHCGQTRVLALSSACIAAFEAQGVRTDRMYIETECDCRGCTAS